MGTSPPRPALPLTALLVLALAGCPPDRPLSPPRLPTRPPGAGDATCPITCGGERLYPTRPAPSPGDADVLALCPEPPKNRVDPEEVRAFFRSHIGDPRLQGAARWAAPFAATDEARAEWLASVWSGPAHHNAFTHVLCGDEWVGRKIGGLHLEARYAQLESEGKLCYEGPAGRGAPACAGGACRISFHGVRGFSCAVKRPIGSFAQGWDAIDVLATGTRAYAACCHGGPLDVADMVPGRGGRYRSEGGMVFQIWCGQRNGRPGLDTFYPTDGEGDCGP